MSPPIFPKTFLGRIVKAAAPRPAFFKKSLLLLSIVIKYLVVRLFPTYKFRKVT